MPVDILYWLFGETVLIRFQTGYPRCLDTGWLPGFSESVFFDGFKDCLCSSLIRDEQDLRYLVSCSCGV